MSPTHIKAVFPKFLVRSVSRSLAYYRDALGFRVASSVGEPAVFAIVERDRRGIHLKQGEPRTRRTDDEGWDAYFEVGGVDALHQEMLGSAAHIVRSPQRLPYGMKEFDVADPDGYVLCFAEDVGAP
jgi:catechol 2,3-dioxygenase-like lactoylglutathione lyase family enzyme